MSNNSTGSQSIFFCFAGAIGAGKSRICDELIAQDQRLTLSVSSTTRQPRPGEVAGVDYNFISLEEFQDLIARQQLVEYTKFNENYYGTTRQILDSAIDQNKDVLLDIEIEGIENLKRIYGERVVTVYVCPPSYEAWKERIGARGDSEEQIRRRLEIAKKEIAVLSRSEFSDYLLINGDLSVSVNEARQIIAVERLRLSRFSRSYISGLFQPQ
ncbi:MAG: guanylate kinase [Deltaproteobacteria bacterium]|nr:guanylate kinase [Deltaproteobacteria bacterium]